MKVTARDLLMSRIIIEADSGCWTWTGSSTREGYGHLKWHCRQWFAHRLSYTTFVGSIPAGLTIDHLCRNPSCINPKHLEAVTQRENTLRGRAPSALNAKKTHCPQRHEYTPANTYVSQKGQRVCRKCQSVHNAAFRARKPQEWLRAKMDRKNLAARRRRAEIRASKPLVTHCKKGHEFTPENTITRNDGNWRDCRECRRIRDRARWKLR